MASVAELFRTRLRAAPDSLQCGKQRNIPAATKKKPATSIGKCPACVLHPRRHRPTPHSNNRCRSRADTCAGQPHVGRLGRTIRQSSRCPLQKTAQLTTFRRKRNQSPSDVTYNPALRHQYAQGEQSNPVGRVTDNKPWRLHRCHGS